MKHYIIKIKLLSLAITLLFSTISYASLNVEVDSLLFKNINQSKQYVLQSNNEIPDVSAQKELSDEALNYALSARQANIYFLTNEAKDFYAKAINAQSNQFLMEEYLTFLVSRFFFDDATEIALKVLENNPKHSLSNLVLAISEVNNGSLDNAIEILEVQSPSPNSINDVIRVSLKAIKYYEDGRADEISSISQDIQKFAPDYYYYLLSAASLYNNQYDEAQTILQQISLQYPSVHSINIYSSLAYANNDKELSMRIFNDYLNDNLIDDSSAYKYISNGTKSFSSKKNIISNILVHVSMLSPDVLDSNLLVTDSFLVNNLSLMLNKENNAAKLNILQFFNEIGNYDDLLEIYNSMDNNNYYKRMYQNEIANLLFEVGKEGDALNLLQNSMFYNIHNPNTFLTLGQIYYSSGNYKKAASSYKYAMKISQEKDYFLGVWLSHYLSGVVYDKLGEWEKAESHLLLAYEIDNTDPILNNYLAYSWIIRDKNIEESLEILKNALYMSNYQNPNILDSYAWGLFKNNQAEEALKFIEMANLINPYDYNIKNHRGDILWVNGYKDEALKSWETASNLATNTEEINSVKEKIDTIPSYLDVDVEEKEYKEEGFINFAISEASK